MPDDSEAIVQEYYGRLNRRDLDGAGELLSDDCHVTVADQELDKDAYLRFLEGWMSGFPDLRNRLDEVVAAGATVAVRSTWEGTHDGAFAGAPATGQHVSFGSFSTSRVQDGRIVERRLLANFFGVLQQIGDVSWRPHAGGASQAPDIAADFIAAVRAVPAAE